MATHSSILAWKISMDRGASWATVHGVTKSQTQLSDSYLHTHTHTHTHTHKPSKNSSFPFPSPRILSVQSVRSLVPCCAGMIQAHSFSSPLHYKLWCPGDSQGTASDVSSSSTDHRWCYYNVSCGIQKVHQFSATLLLIHIYS